MKKKNRERWRRGLAWLLTVVMVLTNQSMILADDGQIVVENSTELTSEVTVTEDGNADAGAEEADDDSANTGTDASGEATASGSETDAETAADSTAQAEETMAASDSAASSGNGAETGSTESTGSEDGLADSTETGTDSTESADSSADSASATESESQAESETEAGSGTESDSESETSPETTEETETEAETETETENLEVGGVLSTFDISVTQEIFLDTVSADAESETDTNSEADSETDTEGNTDADEDADTKSEENSDADSFYAVKYTIKIKNTSTDTDAEDVSVKVVFGEELTWYEREEDATVVSVDDQTDEWYFIEDIRNLSGVPSQYDLDELTEYAENSTNSEKALEPYASAVVWADQKIAAGEEEEYVFYAAITEGITTTDELPALYFVAGEQVTNTAEDPTVIQWKNEALLAQNETETETETEADVETETETETEFEIGAESESEIETETETEIGAQNETETESESESEIGTENEIETETEAETEAEEESEIETESETEEIYNFIVYEVSEGGEICLTYTDGYTESITPDMMSDDYDIEVNMPVTEPVEVSVTAYDGYTYVCAVVLDEEGNTVASYDADTTAFTVTANAEYKTTVQVTFAEEEEAYYFSEEMLEVASYELLAAAAAEDDPDTLQGQINALLDSDDDTSGGQMLLMASSLVGEDTENGTTITLTKNYTGDDAEDLVIWDGLVVTIDLAGYTLAPAGTDKNAVTVYGTLTLTDSSTGGTGALQNTASLSNIRGVIVAQGGSFTMKGGTISGFSASGNGGGVLVENGGTFAMTGGTIDSNKATSYGGGVFLYDADQIEDMTGGTISGNTSGLSGGGLAANRASNSTITLPSGLTISGNTASGNGGGFYYNNVLDTLTISSVISGNTSGSEGGGVYFGASVTTLNITNATIDGNISGAAGGGAYFAVAVPTATINGSSISGNTAAGYGGGIWLTSGTSLTLGAGSKINNNVVKAAGAMYGGGIYLNSANGSRSTFTSTDGEISGNTLTSTDSTNSYGSGIYIGSYASVSMENTTVSDNSGATYGGGIAVNSYVQELTLTGLTVSGNAAVASATANTGIGGGFWIGGNSACEITVSGGTYSENTADYSGGAVYVSTAASSLVLKDAVKIDGNTAYNTGGGIYTEGKLTLTGGESEDTAIWISNNTSTGGQAGGAHANTSTSTALVATGYVNVYKNSAGTNGGGLSVGSGGMDLSGNIKIYENYAKGSNYGGGGLYASSNTAGTVYLHDGVEIFYNTCGLHGGGVYGRYEVKIADGAKIHDNYATNFSGGVAALQLTMEGGEIYYNSAASGGGIYDAYGSSDDTNLESHISGGKIYKNTARTGSGGGIYANSYINILYIDDVEIYDNTAYSYGGGIYWTDLLYFNGGTVTGNTAQRGGGIYIVGYGGQSATIKIADGKSGIIYDNTATAVNYGNDLALGYNSTSVNNSGTYNGNGSTYAVMTVGAASTFKDTANDITGVSWYDEVGDTTTEKEISASSTSSTQSAGQYFTLVYEETGAAVAEIWNTTLNSGNGGYETFTSVQAAVDAVANDTESEYGTENGTDDTITIIMLTDSREDVTITEGLSVTLDLAGCKLIGLKKSVITVEAGASLVIDDTSADGTGLITGGDGTYYQYNGSGYAYCGGGLFVSGSATLKGGTISGNTTAYGGGVYVAAGGTFTLDGGTIASNASSSGAGGGIYVVSNYTNENYKTSTPNFTMTSGSITGNTAGSGAGIYTLSNYTNIEISGGSITGNKATASGGGVFFNGLSVVTVKDVEITGNTAVTGGGLYINNASSSLTVSENAKIYENTATSNSGNDIYAKVKGGSISILAAVSMGNDAYNSWFDSNGDDNTYPNYYTDSIDKNSLSEQHIFALTATYYSGGYVAYIPDDSSSNTVYQIATTDSETGSTTYSYTMDSTAADSARNSGSTVTSKTGTAYSTLQGAINAAGDGDTIYLLCDVNESVSVTGVSGREGLTIDLNGYTLYSTGEYGVYIAYANSVSMTLTIQSTNTDDFANSETDAAGTITKAASNLSDFPRGIYMASGNNTYETYLIVDSVVITGFGNETYASEGYSSTYAGGAIYASSYNSVTLTGNTKITDSCAYQGGGIYSNGYKNYLTIENDVVINGNKAYYGGGIFFSASGPSSYEYTETLTIDAATISGNTAAYRGGGMYVTGWNSTENTSDGSWPKVTMTGTTITENTAVTDSAGIYMQYVTNLSVDGCYITDNASSGSYGGMCITTGSNTTGNGKAVIKDSEFTGNTAATSYAGLAVTYGVVEISGCTFEENKASTNASALYISTVLSGSKVENCTFTKNETTTSGNVIYIISSTVDVSKVAVTGNTTAASVGAVYAVGGSSSVQGNVTFTGCDFSSNSGYGLELLLQGAGGEVVTVKETTIKENNGYGIYMRVTNSLYSYRDSYILNIEDGTEVANNGNTGIFANGYGTININGGKIYGNTGASYGGGVCAQYTDFHMTGGEIYNNTAPRGGGVYLIERTETYTGGTVSSVTYGLAATDTITGGKIYDNTATSTTDAGGGIYVGNYDKLVMTGGTVTGNTASGQGGGVYVASNSASFELGSGTDAASGNATVGQVYGNTAILGQDVYAEYSSSYANTSLALIKAEDMFGDDEGMAGIGWLNESTSVVTTTSIDYDPVKKAYPYTLEYETNTVVAVIWNANTSSYDKFTSVQAAVDALLADKTDGTGNYYTTDITSPEIIMVDDAIGDVEVSGGLTLTLNLNGYTLKGNTTAITCYGTMTIKDVQYSSDAASGDDKYCEHCSELIAVNQSVHDDVSLGAGAGDGCTGTITGTAALTGGGIHVCTGGYVTMVSGQIADCTAGGTTKNNVSYGGAGVYIESGTFVLSGTASINNCSTKSYGAAVYLNSTSGTFILEEDAVIKDNTSYHGAVYIRSGTFKMTGGSITGNTAEGNIDSNTNSGQGGGLYVYAGTVKLSGGEITGNTATGKGGGIYINSGTVTLSGSIKVTDNSVTGTSSTDASIGGGGGIFMQNGTLNIKTGVVISDNSAIRGGGIYQYNGKINMSGGQITGNTAEYGGGLVQYPTQGGTFTMTGGVLCDNISNLSSAGNDVYSVSEDGYTYTGTDYPKASLVRAADMDYTDEKYSASYNVWKDDGYTGITRTAEYVGQGQYITEKITSSYNLMLTAAKYGDTEATETETTQLEVQSLTLTGSGIVDGSSKWDSSDNISYEPVTYTVEIEETEAETETETETQTGTGTETETEATTKTTTTTVSDWSATRLQNALAKDWTAGNDSSASNGLVRTFDKITYNCNLALGFPGAVKGDTTKTVRLYVQVTLPLTSDEAEMTIAGLDSYEVNESDDGKSLILLGYADVKEAADNKSIVLTINVKAMKNGNLVEPSFSSWIEENETNKEDPVTMDPTAVTVSAAGKYNVTLLPNSELAYTGYFDLTTGEETTKAVYDEAQKAGDSSIVYGTVLGYGITLSMWNDDTGKGMKGLEIPEGEITFDLSMTGTLSSTAEGSTWSIEAAPYVWAYKANENTETGSSLNDELRSVNMNWNDEDDSSSTTQYAYDGAPFNTRGANASSSCYSGGAWTATGSQPSSGDLITTVQFSVSGYTIDSTFDSRSPTQTSDGASSEVFNNNYSRAFSAGYIQMLYPIDTSQVGEDDYGYLSIYMEGIVSKLDLTPGPGGIVDAAETETSADSDLQHFVSWYGNPTYEAYATNEIVYLDNYVGNQTGLYVTQGSGETIVKTNYFNNASNSKLSGSGGTASTPLGSTVYIGSDINFGSAAIDATTREGYDPQEDSAIEYNYLTAVDLLQKFDADAYTPTGTYKVTTTESATTWSTNKTTTYDLTVLYAAKPDGTNWNKSDAYYTGYESPAPEMDDYGEEDLIYFTSLDELYAYFEGLGKEGVCVGILYEFRDCCIRTGRSISVTSQMTVTNDFEKTGQTWCITNDVLGWSTYRPDYKDAYAKDLANNTSTRLELSYQYSWTETTYDTSNGMTAYGAGGNTSLQAASKAAAATYTTNSGYSCTSNGCDFAKIAVYEPGYVKTEYSGGWSIKGTHSGWYEGNCLLLYTMESSIAIQVTDTVTGSNTPKSEYDVGQGERTANFLVTPTLASSSSVSNELVSNGTQAADVVITITLPNHLNYNDGTLQFNYGTEDTDYQEGELSWDIEVLETEDSKGAVTTTITLTTTVADISKTLPTISYSTTIGVPGAADGVEGEVANGETLTTKATINIQYEEIGQISTYAKEAETTISVVKTEENYIWIEADGTQELGTDLVFKLNYMNDSNSSTTIEMGDILPYNGDGRGTYFNGGYRVTSLTLTFMDETSYNAFLNAAGLTGTTSTAGTVDIIKYGSGYECTDTSKLGDVLDSLSAGTSLGYSSVTCASDTGGTYKVTFALSAETQYALTQYAATGKGLGLYFYIPSVAAQETLEIDVTLSPMEMNDDGSSKTTMISSAGFTQQGGDIYWDNLFYRVYSASGTKNATVLGSAGNIGILNRKITGLAWLDQDQDGYYNTTSTSTDKPLAGIEVYLYASEKPDTATYTNIETETDSDGKTYWTDDNGTTKYYATTLTLSDGSKVTVHPVADINGNLLGSVTTGTDGTYAFEKLAAGTYYVVFKDSSGSYYVVGSGSTEAPIDFSDLSVTTDMSAKSNSEAVNQSQADYDGIDTAAASGGAADLAQAVITNETVSGSGIELPTSFSQNTYVTSNWNAGFCYIELDMEKVWENIIGEIEEGTAVTFEVTGTTGSGALTVVDDEYTLTQSSTSTNVSVSKNSTIVTSPTVTVPDSAATNGISTVTWKLGTVALKAKGSSGRISYTITEAAINGFVKNVVTTSDSASELSVTATNTQILYALELYKISTSNGTESYLSNATFTLYSDESCASGKEVTSITGSASATSGTGTSSGAESDAGKLYIGQIAAGTYYLKETVAPSGYELNQSVWKINISYDATDPTKPVISITCVKDEDGKPVTDTFGTSTVSTGSTSDYYVSPEVASTNTLYTISFQMEDEIIYSLPQTGSIGIIWPTLAGVALMLAALAMNERKRWKAYA